MDNAKQIWMNKDSRYLLTLVVISFVSPAAILFIYKILAVTEIFALPVLPPITTLLTLVLTVVYLGCFWSFHNYFKVVHKEERDTAHQTEALNQHSMVTKTDLNSDITYANEKFLFIMGYKLNDLVGKTSSTYWPDQEEALLHEIRVTLRMGKKWSGNVQLETKDGKPVHTHSTYVPQMNKKGELIGSIAIRTDISDTKVATGDKNTRRSLHILRDEIYMFEAGTLCYTYLNQAAMKATGWNESNYPQKTVFDRFMPNGENSAMNVKTFYECVRPLVNSEVEEITQELIMGGKPYEVKIQLVRPDVGKPYFMTIVRDISERHAFDKTKDEFISTVSHELRTPLTSIKGALGLVLSGAFGEFNEGATKMLNIAHRNSDRLSLLINDILDLEKTAAGRMEFNLEPIDMAELINDSIQENAPYCKQYDVSMVGIGLNEGVLAYCDRDRVFQVMNNLLSNAAKFSNKGAEILIDLEERDSTIYISVEDFGMGIPQGAQATIFERFTQADSSDRREKGGTGLGLSIVKLLVEKQNGTIDFVSKPGEGTKFFFELPKTDNDVSGEVSDSLQIAAE
ncbi:MAG: PAS domain-containing protein [Rhodobacteraceae bacterium]|nr:PAS domain-containing protein [Paracoccaceae bacterium]